MPHPTKILSVVTQLESGGAQTVAVSLHREFKARGIHSALTFLYEKDNAVFPKRDYECLLENRPNGPDTLWCLATSFSAMWRRFRPDAIISHTHYANNICAILKLSGLGGSLYPVHHNIYSSYPFVSRTLDSIARAFRVYRREIAVSEAVAASLKTRLPNLDVETVVNGFSLTPSTLGKSVARRSFRLPPEAFLIGNIGRLSAQKNQSFLLKLLPLIEGAHLAVLGEGELRSDLHAESQRLGIQDRVHFLGGVVHERVPDFLKALDAFAMPSRFEGLSIAMLEAFAADVPFVGHDIPSIATIATDGAGIVLPLDEHMWASALKQIQTDPVYAESLRERQRIQSRTYSLDRMVDRYLDAVSSDR